MTWTEQKPKGTPFKVQSIAIANPFDIDLIHQFVGGEWFVVGGELCGFRWWVGIVGCGWCVYKWWMVWLQWGLLRLVFTSFHYIFSGKHVVTTRPALYKKKTPYMFEMNQIMLGPNLDMFIGIFGLPGRNTNESLHKTAPSSGDFCRKPSPW